MNDARFTQGDSADFREPHMHACNHEGPCDTSNPECICIANNAFCEAFCACGYAVATFHEFEMDGAPAVLTARSYSLACYLLPSLLAGRRVATSSGASARLPTAALRTATVG